MECRPDLFHNLPLPSWLLHRYQLILLGDRGTRVWTTCLRLLCSSVQAAVTPVTSVIISMSWSMTNNRCTVLSGAPHCGKVTTKHSSDHPTWTKCSTIAAAASDKLLFYSTIITVTIVTSVLFRKIHYAPISWSPEHVKILGHWLVSGFKTFSASFGQ